MEEVKQATISLKTGKASGVDDIVVEWFKLGREKMQFALWLIMNKAWRAEATPQDWKDGIICPIWKDGDKRDPLNYRV